MPLLCGSQHTGRLLQKLSQFQLSVPPSLHFLPHTSIQCLQHVIHSAVGFVYVHLQLAPRTHWVLHLRLEQSCIQAGVDLVLSARVVNDVELVLLEHHRAVAREVAW